MAWTAVLLSLRLFYRRMGIFFAGNALWILVSLPLITWPAATGALFYLAHRVVLEERDLDPDYVKISDFWVGFRTYWRRCTWLAALDLVAGLTIFFTYRFYLMSPYEPLRWLVGPVTLIALVWFGMQLYLFPLLIVSPEQSILSIARKTLFLVLANPLQSSMLVIWLLVLTALCIALAGPVLLLLFAMLALIQTVALRMIRIERGEIPSAKVGK